MRQKVSGCNRTLNLLVVNCTSGWSLLKVSFWTALEAGSFMVSHWFSEVMFLMDQRTLPMPPAVCHD
jgi:hypothetical protein